MTDVREDSTGRPGFRSWVNDLRIGVNAEDYRRERNLDLGGKVMTRAAEIAARKLAGGRTPKETIMLEDIVDALRETEGPSAAPDDVEALRRRLRRSRTGN